MASTNSKDEKDCQRRDDVPVNSTHMPTPRSCGISSFRRRPSGDAAMIVESMNLAKAGEVKIHKKEIVRRGEHQDADDQG